MSIKRINEFPEGSGSLSSDDIFLFMDDPSGESVTKKISLSELSSIIGGGSGVGISFQIAPVDLHNGGVQTAQVLQFDDNSKQSVITGPTPPSGNSSQRIIIQGQRAQGGGEGGDVYVWGGDSDANGGDIKIYAGDADNVSPDSGYGGYVNIDGGKGATTGGNVEITAGYSVGGQAGDVDIVGGSTSSGVAGDVKIKTNNDNGSFNTWTFSPDGGMTFPSGSIISETNNTISIMPPTAVSGQSLVIRPTQNWSLTSNHPEGFAPGDSITITFTPNTSSVGSFAAAYTFTGCTEEQLGRSLTGSLVYTEEETESLTWTIPSISNITSFTFTIQNVAFPADPDPFITISSTGSVSNEPSHLHLVAGDPTTVDLFLGDDDQYIKIEKNAGDVVIGTNSDTNHWIFGTDGGMTFPDGSIQTTAFGNLNISTCLLHEYADPSGVSTPTYVAIDGMSYGGGQVVVDSAFGLDSSRVTLYSNSMFAMVAVNADIETVYYNGETGLDSNGDKTVSVGVNDYRGYYSYDNLIFGDYPEGSIQQIVISKSPIMSGNNRSIDTNNDDFTVDGLSGSDVIIVLNLYWASPDGPDNSNSTTVAIQQFIDLVMFDEATPRTNINDIRTAFYDNSATIKTAIENENSDLLFDGFEFYRSFQNVTPSGGSGSGAVLEIEVFDDGDYDDSDVLVEGTGYQVEDTLTVTGDLLGGTTPTNDVTITVNGINEAGGIIGYSVVGTSINTLWPDSYIIDGDDDQYDIGNFIGTNRTRSTAMVTLAYDVVFHQILTILSADKTISEGQWVWFEEQNKGAFINYTLSTSSLNSSDISDFSSAVSELLPVKDIVQGSGVSVTSSSGTFTVSASGLDASYISDFDESVDDRVGDLLIAGAAISLDYVDASGTLTISAINEVALDSQEPNGFVDRLDCTISTSGNVFSISPTGSSYQVYIQGVKFTKNATETFTIPSGVTGPNYIHFNIVTGDLDNKTTPFNFSTDIPVAYVVWNSTSQSVVYLGDERHGIHMDKATHLYLHNTQGTQYISGLSISNYVLDGNGSSNSHASIAIGDGVIYDEDLVINITNGSGGEPFHQVLSPSGYIPVYYHNGAVGSWAVSTNSYPLKYSANGAQYNKLNGTWTAADATTNSTTKYISMFICASNNIHAPIFAIMGQKVYNSQGAAENNGTWESLDLTYLPANEMKPLYRLVYATDRDWTNTPKSSLQSILDLRSQALAMGGLTQNDHGSLYGLADDDHLQYVHIDNARTISANHTFANGLTASGTISAASGTFTSLSVSGTGVALSGHSHTASNISDFSSSVSGLLPTLSAGSGINLSAGSGNSIIISSSGTVSSYPTPTVVNLSVVSSTISTNASAGQIFNVALTSSATLSNPTNPIDGVTLRWRIQQDAYGSRTVTLGDKFQIPTSATSPLPFSTAPYTIDLLAATYNSANDNWDIIAFVMGY